MKKSNGTIFGDAVIYGIMGLIIVITLYPFLNILAISLNDSLDSMRGGIYLFPRVFTLKNYEEVFKQPNLFRAFINSVLRTVIGTFISILSTTLMAYVISRKDFFARKQLSILFVMTLYVSGGLIPEFILIKKLDLLNKFAVYVIPGMINVFYIFVLRSFIDEIPNSLQESAQIDGANDLTIFFKIILPLCKPALATVGLYYAVGQWNAWFDTYLFASAKDELTTLQYELMKLLNSSNASATAKVLGKKQSLSAGAVVTPEAIRMAITIVATIPIIMVYPFLQKYFVKGLTMGAVKN